MKEKQSRGRLAVELLVLCAAAVPVGVLGGAVGAAFAHTLSRVTALREGAPWLLWLLPAGGLATVLLYRLFRLSDHGGANEVIRCTEKGEPIRLWAAPLIFVCAAMSHLFGASAGKEGAALQLGGAGAAAIARLFRLRDRLRRVLVLCGMSAVFAGVFGMPVTAGVFVLEFRAAWGVLPLAALPCLLSSFAAAHTAALLGVEKEVLPIVVEDALSLPGLGRAAVLAAGVCLLGAVVCFVFHKGERLAKRYLPNPAVRILCGAAVILLMTLAVGDMRYSGSGMEMAIHAVEGHGDWFDFLLKMAFTAVTVAAGFKGGEIVPVFCIGATFGCAAGALVGMDPSFGAALGLVGLFGYATNSVVSAVVLGAEMFGLPLLPCFVLVSVIVWLLSNGHSLFDGKIFAPPVFGKKH